MNLRQIVKRLAQAVCLGLVSPAALLCGFGRVRVLFDLFAHAMSVLPGVPGNFLRAAFYKFTLVDSSIDVDIWFGAFFARRGVTLAPHVSIGSYCVLAEVDIGPRTQIASHVEIPGRQQHRRDPYGRLSHSGDKPGEAIRIGADCWIGASAVIMANVGDRSTIGAGSVVVKEIPAGVVAVGTPAKPIKSSIPSESPVPE
jgi:acetyltransferase-like isoleucine patch superfamily enzyme